MMVSPLSQFRFVFNVWVMALVVVSVSATTVMPPQFSDLVNESDYIVHARVTDVRSEWRTDRPTRSIVTYVTLEVLEVVAGHPPEMPVLRFLGGQVGDEVMRIEGSPQFAVGDEDILFVRGNGRSLCPLYAMGHGRYPVAAESATGRKEVRLASGQPLTDIAAISEPLHAASAEAGATHDHDAPSSGAKAVAAAEATGLSAPEFIAKIRAEVRPGSRVTTARVE